jgi:hypothetical protein
VTVTDLSLRFLAVKRITTERLLALPAMLTVAVHAVALPRHLTVVVLAAGAATALAADTARTANAMTTAMRRLLPIICEPPGKDGGGIARVPAPAPRDVGAGGRSR